MFSDVVAPSLVSSGLNDSFIISIPLLDFYIHPLQLRAKLLDLIFFLSKAKYFDLVDLTMT